MNPDNSKLKIFNSNIIKWYPFEENKTILQIGQNDFITKELENKFQNIEIIDNIDKVKENIKYDYILIYGYEKYSDFINVVTNILYDDGKILIIGNNDLGINNWSKYNNEFDKGISILEDYNKKFKTLRNIKKELNSNNLFNINTFYVFPNYNNTELILNENFEINENDFERYNPEIFENEIKIFDEKKVLKTLINNKKDILDFFTNSYFLEVSKKEKSTDIKFVSFNNCRREQYRLMTIIKDDVVEKIPTNEKANSHIENMSKIINEFNECNIEILDYVENKKLYSNLIKNKKTLDVFLAENKADIDKLVNILNQFKEQIMKNNTINYEECKNEIYVEEDEKYLKELTFLKSGYWDMVPKNCFFIDNKFMFFDQEWKKNYISAEFIIYRSIINSYDLVRRINVDELFEKLGILKYKSYFEKIDKELRNEIIDEEIYEVMYKQDNIKAIDNLINENKSLFNEDKVKNEYIQKLEKYIEDLKDDNSKKQQYIEILEKMVNKKR